MTFTIIRNDITKLKVDAIVNAANTELSMGGGVCGAIFTAAGVDRLSDACDRLAPIKTGEAVITPGFDLPAKYIIHTAGPIYLDGGHGEEALLRSCYVNSLDLALKNNCESVAFPLISSGIYGYPKDEALSVATSSIGGWLMENDMEVSLVVFDKAAFSLSKELLGDIEAFIDERYVSERETKYSRSGLFEHLSRRRTQGIEPQKIEPQKIEPQKIEPRISELFEPQTRQSDIKENESQISERLQYYEDAFDKALKPKPTRIVGVPEPSPSAAQAKIARTSIDEEMRKLDEPFSETLLRLIDSKGKTDVEIYKRANIDRKLFSKIRNPEYRPSKKTALALSVALELSRDETDKLLERAGFALSRSHKFDVIVEYFITRGIYNVYEINNALFEYDQPLLGG